MVHHRERRFGNIFVRDLIFDAAGDSVDNHSHNFDHTTQCVRGAMMVSVIDPMTLEVRSSVVLKASDGENQFLVEADKSHRVTALEPDTLGQCLYSHRDANGEVVQTSDNPRAYF